MNLLGVVSSIVNPITNLIDDLFTSDEERAKAKTTLREVENKLAVRILGYENQLLKAKAEIIKAEAEGKSWLQRNWRPITMITFLILVVCDSFGLLTFRLSAEAWTLLQIGLGGYVVGRSAEKVIPKLIKKEK